VGLFKITEHKLPNYLFWTLRNCKSSQ